MKQMEPKPIEGHQRWTDVQRGAGARPRPADRCKRLDEGKSFHALTVKKAVIGHFNQGEWPYQREPNGDTCYRHYPSSTEVRYGGYAMHVFHPLGIIHWGDLVRNLVAKEIKVRYMGATLGFAWSLGNPLMAILTYYTVFTYILPSGQDRFALHLVTGVLHWMLLQQIISQSCEWLTNNHSLIQKIRFPRLLLPVSGALTIAVFWSVAMAVYWALFPMLGGVATQALLWYPLVLGFFAAFLAGTGLTLSVLQVLHRDIKHLVDVFIPLLFWLTPIVWVASSLPVEMQQIVVYNPVAPFFNAFTSILHEGVSPEPTQLLLCAGLGFGAMFVGLAVFLKKVDTVAEYL